MSEMSARARMVLCVCLSASLLWAAGCGGEGGGDDGGDGHDLHDARDGAHDGAGDVDTGGAGPDVDDALSDGADGDADQADGVDDADAGPDVVLDGPPEVVATQPVDGAQGVARDAALVVTFSEPIDEATLAGAWQIAPPASGALLWDEAARQVTFAPNVFYQPETTYEVTIDEGLRDRSGEGLAQAARFSFTTAAGEVGPGETSTYSWRGYTATVVIDDPQAEARAYTLSSDAPLRDGEPASGEVRFGERAGQLRVRTGHEMFDALFALAIEEARQCSVSQISDYAFNEGAGVACECFETGAKWNYVWTRDTAYAVDLGLALVDPTRAMNSLDFKLSEPKGGGPLQVVQDTGSGGSYPVSTDRVVWALGAWEALKFLDGAERQAFLARAYEALVTTIEVDRAQVHDPRDGLYRGEQSFLDWREQSYPSWTANDTVHIGMSKSLSTNVGHHAALQVAAWLAEEQGLVDDAARYQGWADALAQAIHEVLWLDDVGQYAAFRTTELDPAPVYKHDLLGSAQAILTGVAPTGAAARLIAGYPHAEAGPPVLWPQQPLIPIYHNRGDWPFVTAYAALAARAVGNGAVFEHDLESLIRGAALNLSNMENFEFLSHLPWVEDGAYSGPVVNSRRQLWSVAGYVGAVVKGVFGMEATQEGLRFAPFITPGLHARYFSSAPQIALRGLSYRGRVIDVEVSLPTLDVGAEAPYAVRAVYLDGVAVDADAVIAAADLGAASTLRVELEAGAGDGGALTVIEDNGDHRRFWSPRDPQLTALTRTDAGLLELAFDAGGESSPVTFNVYRDGVRVAEGLSGPTWTDPDSGDRDARAHCYTVESVFPTSGNHSQHARPRCDWGDDLAREQRLSAYVMRSQGGQWSFDHGAPHHGSWGAPDDTLEVAFIRPRWSGEHLIQLVAGNGAGPVSTGITAAVKRLIVTDLDADAVVAEGVVMVPHRGSWDLWGESSFLRVTLDAERRYRLTIRDGENMSYLAHFIPYTAGNGGGASVYNNVNVQAIKLLSVAGVDHAPALAPAASALDGVDDVADLGASQTLATGIPVAAAGAFALTWDEAYLYVAVRSDAFLDPYRPFNLYLEAAPGALAAPLAGQGFEYSGLTPELPFTPTHVVSVRQRSHDAASGEGPWNGLWSREAGGAWQRVLRLEPGVSGWLAATNDAVSLRIPRAALGDPTRLRLAGHVVNAVVAEEWKETVPAAHTPWQPSSAGYYELDLGGPTATSSWTER